MSNFFPFRKVAELSTSCASALAFSPDGQGLAIGEDSVIRLWNISDRKWVQELPSSGLVTSLSWITSARSSPAVDIICSGSDQGSVMLYTRPRPQGVFLCQVNTSPFELGDSVESIAYDRAHTRFAFGSHSGIIKVYDFDAENCQLTLSWQNALGQRDGGAIASLQFYHEGSVLLAASSLAGTGQISCQSAENGSRFFPVHFNHPIGSVVLSRSQERFLLYDPLPGRSYLLDRRFRPLHALSTPSSSRIAKQVALLGHTGHLAACGGDDGNIYVFDTAGGSVYQTLHHDRLAVVYALFPSIPRYLKGWTPKPSSVQTVVAFDENMVYTLAGVTSYKSERGKVVIWTTARSPNECWIRWLVIVTIALLFMSTVLLGRKVYHHSPIQPMIVDKHSLPTR
ncbi:hypothetical protein V5O48_002798, partial [Marasmius crinis-equi]